VRGAPGGLAGCVRFRAGFRVGLVVAALMAMGALDAVAQLSARAGGGVHLQHFTMSDDEAAGFASVSLLSVPYLARVQVAGPFSAEVSTTWARGSVDRGGGGEAVVVSGLTDSRFRLFADLVPNRVTLMAEVAASTGVDGFDEDEGLLAGILAADLLPFRVSSWGSGGGVGGNLTAFHPMGDIGIGGSLGYTVPGTFNPIADGDFSYRPGSVLSAMGLIDYTQGTAGRYALQLRWDRYGDDEVTGENLFRSGDRLQVRGSYAFGVGLAGSGVVYGGYLHRSEGTFLQQVETRPAQGLFFAGGGLRRPWGPGVMVPDLELRVHRRDDGVGQGFLGSLGVALEVAAGALQVEPRLRLHGGSVLVREGVRSGVLGGELGVNLRSRGGR
jgi:hypothetical protein